MQRVLSIGTFCMVIGCTVFLSPYIAFAEGVLVGMLSKVSGRTITVTTSNGASKEFRISSNAFITDLATRKKIEATQLRPGSKVRVSSKGDSFMAVEVLEVPK